MRLLIIQLKNRRRIKRINIQMLESCRKQSIKKPSTHILTLKNKILFILYSVATFVNI
ncbi:hypothetical protein LCDVSa150L [Lymphocystis disease virus 3]|uniref:Uncharacterized protein n=1 Tax=Lymphocystis disease virus 3 TaxID=2560566 RepID=A0A1B2RW53_9VIRU|nr:hypothetical protein BZK12_gp150 [Lymphocystis disease virus Sa]AOC55234.1 hypothetical protein LCDVSa150L [Lymphocystis disease virus 3]